MPPTHEVRAVVGVIRRWWRVPVLLAGASVLEISHPKRHLVSAPELLWVLTNTRSGSAARKAAARFRLLRTGLRLLAGCPVRVRSRGHSPKSLVGEPGRLGECSHPLHDSPYLVEVIGTDDQPGIGCKVSELDVRLLRLFLRVR
jgi:hypothetical protein